MDRRRQFCELIRKSPKDDAPRLAYADWLDEQGDPRGEFIRVQCELANLVRENRPGEKLLRRREEELLNAFQDQWLSSLSDFIVRDGRFERGFLTRATLIYRVKHPMSERWPRLFDAEPTLSDVELVIYDGWEDLRKLGKVPQLRSLRLRHQRLERREVSCLVHSRAVRGLRTLDLSHNYLRSGVDCIARSASLSGLQELDLSFNHIGTRGARAIASSPFLRSLKSLNLRGNNIGFVAKQRLRAAFGSRVLLSRYRRWDQAGTY